MDMLLHKAATRGYFDHGWLRTHHTFSFADYYDPARLNFGALRVLNDDTVVPGAGFGMHPHREMEVVSIPLSGRLEHKDSLGHADVIRAGEIQAMSAGTGIYHSEYNPSRSAPVEVLQIWIFPNRRGVKPRYENAVISDLARPGELSEIVSPYPGNGRGLWIYQDAWLSLGDLRQNTRVEYVLHSAGSYGVYRGSSRRVIRCGCLAARRAELPVACRGAFSCGFCSGNVWTCSVLRASFRPHGRGALRARGPRSAVRGSRSTARRPADPAPRRTYRRPFSASRCISVACILRTATGC